jgi:hypothetical protein
MMPANTRTVRPLRNAYILSGGRSARLDQFSDFLKGGR